MTVVVVVNDNRQTFTDSDKGGRLSTEYLDTDGLVALLCRPRRLVWHAAPRRSAPGDPRRPQTALCARRCRRVARFAQGADERPASGMSPTDAKDTPAEGAPSEYLNRHGDLGAIVRRKCEV